MAHPRGRLTPATEDAPAPGPAEWFAALPVAALVVRPDGRVAHANSACEALLNHSERSMQGQPLDSLVQLPPGPAARRDGHGFAAYDVDLLLDRTGPVRADYVESALPEPPGWRLVTIHPEGASRRLASAAERSGGARAAVGAAAMLAHEIKNPLSGIRGAAQLLAHLAEPEERRELTALITSEVDRIAALIDRMEDFTDQRPRDLSPGNIYPLLAHARQLASAGFAREIAIEERFDPSLPEVLLDRDAFLQMLLNLLKNAAEALDGVEAPRITLATAYRHGVSVSGGRGQPRRPLPIELCVIDNGPGAPPELAEHLFEPFVSGKREGRGLGLPLVEKLVGELGGVIRYSREGDPPSTVFRILLPRAPDA
ncbi:nitrogen regulation protein NR(II) [Sphingomonas sp. ac-8]|uniref:two-component system sensor histidine kinase NtrB n=1 Tax=Sphingomonas sp. ac-8 TaxID=3242977 RepID=UPI003A7FEA9C